MRLSDTASPCWWVRASPSVGRAATLPLFARSSTMRALCNLVSHPPVRLAARHTAAASRSLQARRSAGSRVQRGARLAASGDWQQAVDASSGKTYYWNTRTNEVAWELPAEAPAEAVEETQPASAPQLSFPELEALLSATQPVYLSKVVEPYRDAAFSDAFTDYLTQKIGASLEKADRERLEKLRARLANPLIRQPPPFL